MTNADGEMFCDGCGRRVGVPESPVCMERCPLRPVETFEERRRAARALCERCALAAWAGEQ